MNTATILALKHVSSCNPADRYALSEEDGTKDNDCGSLHSSYRTCYLIFLGGAASLEAVLAGIQLSVRWSIPVWLHVLAAVAESLPLCILR